MSCHMTVCAPDFAFMALWSHVEAMRLITPAVGLAVVRCRGQTVIHYLATVNVVLK